MGVIANFDRWFLEGVEVVQSSNLIVERSNSQRISMRHYQPVITCETKIFYGIFKLKSARCLRCIPDVPKFDRLIGRGSEQSLFGQKLDLFDVVRVSSEDRQARFVAHFLNVIESDARVVG